MNEENKNTSPMTTPTSTMTEAKSLSQMVVFRIRFRNDFFVDEYRFRRFCIQFGLPEPQHPSLSCQDGIWETDLAMYPSTVKVEDLLARMNMSPNVQKAWIRQN